MAIGFGCILGKGNQVISSIHVEDLVRAIQFLLDHRIYGAINLTSPFPVIHVYSGLNRTPIPALAEH